MTEERDKATWLPNLVAGVSIWKLAVDLNEAKFFDGRLLVPETEGSDSLPVKVRWNVQGMIPLSEARERYPEDADTALREFFACLEKVGAEFASPTSGYRKYKDAFTVPSLEADDGANYFFSPDSKKLFVINWGSSPRAIAGQGLLVFGWDSFGRLLDKANLGAAGAGAGTGKAAAAGAAAAGVAAAAADGAAKTDDDKKKDDEKKDEKKPVLLWGRAWWVWLLVLLAIVALLAIIGLLMKGCEELPVDSRGADASADAAKDGASDGGDAGAASDGGDSGATGSSDAGDAGADAASGDAGDAGKDGGADGGDAGDGGKDGGKDAGKDAKGDGDGSGSGSGSGGTIITPRGAKIILVPGKATPASPEIGLPYRGHFRPEAERWRITQGRELLYPGSPPDWTGDTFDVFLQPGASFENLRVEWMDRGGQWHPH